MTRPLEAEFLGHFPLPAGKGPTARLLAVDVSREAARASGTDPAWTGSLPDSRPCVCGGTITARTSAYHHIVSALREHYLTERHERWRKAAGL